MSTPVDLQTPIVQAVDLSKQVEGPAGKLLLLEGVSFAIAPAETVAISGASGAGKSTLLGLLAGLDEPSEGQVYIDGVDLSALDEDSRAALRGQCMGFVFQSFQLLNNLTALENVTLPLELAHRKDARETACRVLDRVGLTERMAHYPQQLSGGEQQRVAIARAFAPRPKVLFADEPTGNLDQITGHHVIDLLFQLNQEQQTTLLVVTHDEELASRCHHRMRLDCGRLVGAHPHE